MNLPNDLIEFATSEPLAGVLRIIEHVQHSMSVDTQGFDSDDQSLLLEAFALVSSLSAANLISVDVYEPEVSGNTNSVCTVILQYFNAIQSDLETQATALKLESLKRKFTAVITGGFGYEFTDGDIKRVQALINELRELLAADSSLDENHKKRLLLRLEALQKELHKKISNLNSFYSLLGDAGVVLGKLGTDAKPFIDRIREIVQIGWKAQARAEELPSSAENPMLGHDDEPPALG